jgi:hypothetical protein
MADLTKSGLVTRVRKLSTGRTIGGIPFGRGMLAHLLRNRFYVGEVVFKGEILPGEQRAIVDRTLFDDVQAKLTEQLNNHTTRRMKSEALLMGRIFDDRGNRMGPSHARKRGIKYRYYLSSTLLQGQPERSGTISRVPAAEIEEIVVRSVREHLKLSEQVDERNLISAHVARVEVQANQLLVKLLPRQETDGKGAGRAVTLRISWKKVASRRRREILLPEGGKIQHARPIRSETRATLVASIARGRRWLDELTRDPQATADGIAKRERCSPRKVNMTVSLAFLSPDLVKAAIEGRLPHGMGVARLCDMPAEWSRQHQVLGLLQQ